MMKEKPTQIAFGPVPSRRLGKSLGINNIPPKNCTYSCTYCQLGLTAETENKRRAFFDPKEVFDQVQKHMKALAERGEKVDFFSFVPDGEPTLDLNLGKEIDLLHSLGTPVAVISNASLLWDPTVRGELAKADWVCLKVDSVIEKSWRAINRPHPSIQLEKVLDGILTFASKFKGVLTTETMLLSGANGKKESLMKTATYLSEVKPRKSFILLPTRPPAVSTCRGVSEEVLLDAFEIFSSKLKGEVEILGGSETTDFGTTGEVEKDLLGIVSVHPMREKAVEELLKKTQTDWSVVEKMVEEKLIKRLDYQGETFFLRSFSNH